MITQRLARIISVILGPLWLPLLLVAVLLRSGLSKNQLYILFPLLLLFQVVIPVAYLYLAVHFKKASSWDLPKREERYLFLAVSLVSYLISVVLIYFLANQFIFRLSLILIALLIIISVITYFWKISLHASMNTVGSILLNLLFGWSLPILYLVIPTIFWARLTLKRHSVAQLIGGTLVGGAFTLLALKYFGYF